MGGRILLHTGTKTEVSKTNVPPGGVGTFARRAALYGQNHVQLLFRVFDVFERKMWRKSLEDFLDANKWRYVLRPTAAVLLWDPINSLEPSSSLASSKLKVIATISALLSARLAHVTTLTGVSLHAFSFAGTGRGSLSSSAGRLDMLLA